MRHPVKAGAADDAHPVPDVPDLGSRVFDDVFHTMSKAELLKWADDVLTPTAKLAMDGKGEFKAGDHCQFCKVKATCRKRAEYNLELARYDFEMPAELEAFEIDAILMKAGQLAAWAADVKEYALSQALLGVDYGHFKVVEGRSNRRYTSEAEVAAAVSAAGYNPFEQKLLGITAMTSLLVKKKFEQLLGRLVEKPQIRISPSSGGMWTKLSKKPYYIKPLQKHMASGRTSDKRSGCLHIIGSSRSITACWVFTFGLPPDCPDKPEVYLPSARLPGGTSHHSRQGKRR